MATIDGIVTVYLFCKFSFTVIVAVIRPGSNFKAVNIENSGLCCYDSFSE
jgi:hypothetical protein